MNNLSEQVRISKRLSFWLRHNPAAGGIALDSEGWATVDDVLAALSLSFRRTVTIDELLQVVRENDKQRFTLEQGRIRANQGHSVSLQMSFRPVTPPDTLFHGTTEERWQKIQRSGGLQKMRRHHVHLSATLEAAVQVARRHRSERPLVLKVDSASMQADGHVYFVSDNGVYLTDEAPLRYLSPVVDTPV